MPEKKERSKPVFKELDEKDLKKAKAGLAVCEACVCGTSGGSSTSAEACLC